MIKVYQQKVDRVNGDCMQAVMASLFEKPMDEVPKFIETTSWFSTMRKFVMQNGYKFDGMIHNKNYTSMWHTKHDCFNEQKWHRPSIMTKKRLYNEPGVNGLFYAAVLSPKYFNFYSGLTMTHAVIIDRDYNIVFDPNPGYADIIMYPLAKLLGYNGVIDVEIINPK